MRWLNLISLLSLVASCTQPASQIWSPPQIPDHLGVYPHDTAMSIAEVELGKDLFFDPLLSGNRGISCSSCHLPHLAFTDGKPVSVGVGGALGMRNAPSLYNLVYKPMFFAEGGVFPLERTINPPLETDFEMDHNMGVLVRDLRKNDYAQRFQEVYSDSAKPVYVVDALSAYMRTLLTVNTPYDQYLSGKRQFSEAELQGLEHFKTHGCAQCHSLPMTTGYQFAWNGYNSSGEDAGRFRLTLKPEDDHTFMVPSLRNVSVTAPYFHDGGAASLEDVLDHYAQMDTLYLENEPVVIQSFSDSERQQVLAFLQTLTEDFSVNKN